MQTEIMTSSSPCRTCGMHLTLHLRDEGLSEDGSHYVAYRSEQVPHDRRACDAFVTLSREAWPTLW